mmetsp:Transcript_13556/g.20503  ORF Transcript_13556/g.20503 Transcript_13556/m.20503 type:complete len:244 (+) Transcript_13556:56-787(+)
MKLVQKLSGNALTHQNIGKKMNIIKSTSKNTRHLMNLTTLPNQSCFQRQNRIENQLVRNYARTKGKINRLTRSALYKNNKMLKRVKPLWNDSYTFVSLENKPMTQQCWEETRITIVRYLRKVKNTKYKMKFYGKFNRPFTKKPVGSRMGKGKGGVDHYLHFFVNNSKVIEMRGIGQDQAERIHELVSNCLSVKVKMIREYEEGPTASLNKMREEMEKNKFDPIQPYHNQENQQNVQKKVEQAL